MKALAQQGCKIIVVSPMPYVARCLVSIKKKWKLYKNIPLKANLEGREIYYPRYLALPRNYLFGFSGEFIYWGIKKIILDIYKNFKFDLLHAYTIMPDGYAAYKLSKYFAKPCICTVEGSDINLYPEKSPWIKKKTISALLNMDRLVAASNSLKLKMNTLAGRQLDVEVIPNGVDIAKFKVLGRDEARRKLNLDLNKRILVFVGNLIREKGIDSLLDALRIIKEEKGILTIILGEGPLKRYLQKRSPEVALGQNKIMLKGQVPHDEIPLWMNAADLLILPSLSEGWPTVISEALACGLPVIASAVGGIPEAIKDEHYGILVPPSNPAALSQAIIVGLKRDWDRQALFAYAKDNSWQQCATRYMEIYRKIIDGNQ